MKATIVLAFVTSGLVQLGVGEAAELSYAATAFAAWTFGGRAIAEMVSRERAQTLRSRITHHIA